MRQSRSTSTRRLRQYYREHSLKQIHSLKIFQRMCSQNISPFKTASPLLLLKQAPRYRGKIKLQIKLFHFRFLKIELGCFFFLEIILQTWHEGIKPSKLVFKQNLTRKTGFYFDFFCAHASSESDAGYQIFCFYSPPLFL